MFEHKEIHMKRFSARGTIGKASSIGAAFCLLCILAASSAEAQENSGDKAASAAQAEAELRQASLDKLIAQYVKEADKLLADAKYSEAEEKLKAADAELAPLGSGTYVEYNRDNIRSKLATLYKKWGNSLMGEAKDLYQQKKYKDASETAREAGKVNPLIQKDVDAFIKKCDDTVASNEFKNKTSLTTIDPQNATRKEEIDILFHQSEILYKNQQYAQVKDNMEKILIKDPYNTKAVDMLDKVYKKLYHAAQKRRENEILEREADVAWGWSQGVVPTESIMPKNVIANVDRKSRASLYDKLQRIILDLDFDGATVSSVIAYLNTRSKEKDPEKQGVNLILQLSPEIAANVPKVTMSFDKIPMSEAIRYLCQGTGLKYRIEEKAVIIGDKDIDELETRFFQVRAALVSRISGGVSETEETKTNSDDIKDLFTSTKDTFKAGGAAATKTAPPPSATSEALKKFFADRGVPFDEGTSIAYDKRAGKLIVTNTPDNLRRLEALMRGLDIQTPLVLIEAKLLEIGVNDLDELGFDWVLNNTNANLNPNWNAGGNGTAGISKILRSYNTADSGNPYNSTTGASDKILNEFKLLPNFGKDGAYNLYVTINAISQNTRTEVLSSPKVIATSGSTALIRLVEERYFPTSWEDPEIQTSNGTITIDPPSPEFGEPTDIGIRFEVTPTVSPNNYTISLQLNPQVLKFEQWDIYQIVIRRQRNADPVQEDTYDVKMPVISRRDLNTNVKVYDGETVVLGGMLRDSKADRNDKWPGLGDIPLVGRLFSSQMTRSDKKNLLIFVTTRLVNNDGVPVRQDPRRGIPDYHR